MSATCRHCAAELHSDHDDVGHVFWVDRGGYDMCDADEYRLHEAAPLVTPWQVSFQLSPGRWVVARKAWFWRWQVAEISHGGTVNHALHDSQAEAVAAATELAADLLARPLLDVVGGAR